MAPKRTGEPLVIHRSTDRSGATYALSPATEARIRRAFPAAHIPPRVFVAHETKADYEAIHGSIRRQIVQLLTGLDEERLSSLGPVSFRDPVTERVIPSAPPAPR